jgi:hypothetical protein
MTRREIITDRILGSSLKSNTKLKEILPNVKTGTLEDIMPTLI